MSTAHVYEPSVAVLLVRGGKTDPGANGIFTPLA